LVEKSARRGTEHKFLLVCGALLWRAVVQV